MQKLLTVLFLILSLDLHAQTRVSGTVKDKKGQPVPGANIFLKDTYDGTTSAANGEFSFTSDEKGEQTLSVTFIGFEPFVTKINLDGQEISFHVTLLEAISELKTVTISAGAFEASDERKMVILRPLDIVTTAGAMGDIYGAIQTLPGTGVVGEKEGLYVRGGDATETKTFIDGLMVDNPYYTSVPDVPQRGRFSPFLFKGTSFSSGGYSAQYGQAMSSALILESQDLAEQTVYNIGIMSVGLSAGINKAWKKTSLGIYSGYINVSPYYSLVPQLREWKRAPQSSSGSIVFRQKTSQTGIIKAFISYGYGDLSVGYPDTTDPFLERRVDFTLFNNNLFSNLSYKEIILKKWTLYATAAYSSNDDNIHVAGSAISGNNTLFQSRLTLSHPIGKLSVFRFGGEFQKPEFKGGFNEFRSSFEEEFSSAYVEGDIYITRKFVSRIGGRFEYSKIMNENNLAPRASLAYKTGEYSQVSFGYGDFYQSPDRSYFTNYGSHPILAFEKATHYILNFQHVDEKRTFRVEGYYKQYADLVRSIHLDVDPNTHISLLQNSGKGYAKGFEVFLRDKKTWKYADYWISYSYLDTKRLYKDFPVEAAPTFSANHTASMVFKYWIADWSLYSGFTYVYSSGRPYYNPNNPVFLGDHVPDYHNLSLNFSYITGIFKNFAVVVASVNNILGVENIYTYQYSKDGQHRVAVGPPALRSFFAALFINIGSKTDDSDKYN